MDDNPAVAAAPSIIHEDEELLILDKPAGMPSVSLKEGEEGTLAAWILARHPAQSSVGEGSREAGLVHRLDNDTSGLVVAAKSEEAREKLKAAFKGEIVEKIYTALVLGSPPESGVIEAPIAHHPSKKKKMVVCESMKQALEWKARPAHTRYRVLMCFSLEAKGRAPLRYSLLEVRITTGLRHQIRLHLASIGHPIAGDRLYQNPRARLSDPLPLTRQFLHASKLSFPHPDDGKTVEFFSPLPEDLERALSLLSAS